MRVLLFVEASGAFLGPPLTIGRKMARSLESYVSGLIAGLQPSKSDFRSFSTLLTGQFLLQIKVFRGPKLPKHHFKAQKSKIQLKMSKNGFRLDASDWENCALRTAPASQQNFWQIQTGRYSAFCLSWKLLGPSWGFPHDRPENGSFSGILCQRFNSRIAAVKIRFSELFQAFVKSISAPNQAL